VNIKIGPRQIPEKPLLRFFSSTEKFMNQKLAYMHANPCAGKWKLCKTPVDYEHSSARFYISSRHAAYKVTNVDEILKIINSAETTANAQGNE
jgi:hypothetical protein